MSIKLTRWDRTYEIEVYRTTYLHGGGLAITLDYYEFECWLPFGVLTVNLEDYPTAGNNAFVDTNNFGPEIIDWIIENDLGTLTGRIGYSGYCEYPEVEFNVDKIKQSEVN